MLHQILKKSLKEMETKMNQTWAERTTCAKVLRQIELGVSEDKWESGVLKGADLVHHGSLAFPCHLGHRLPTLDMMGGGGPWALGILGPACYR